MITGERRRSRRSALPDDFIFPAFCQRTILARARLRVLDSFDDSRCLEDGEMLTITRALTGESRRVRGCREL